MMSALLPLLVGAALGAPPLAGANVCSFADSSVGPGFDATVVGTRTRLGEIGAWGGDPKMRATLGTERGRPWMRIEVWGGGLSVLADVDVGQETVLSLLRTVYRDSTLIAPEAPVVVAGFDGDKVLVTPLIEDLALQPAHGLTTTVACEDLHVGWYLDWDYDRQVERMAGLEGRERWLLRGRARLRDEPGGAVIATLRRDRAPASVAALERRDGWVKVGLAEWQGVLWRGWVREEELEGPEEPGDGALGVLGTGGLGVSATPSLRACAEDLPLRHVNREGATVVGSVAAGTPFEVIGAGRDDLVEVRFPRLWLEAAEGTALALPAGAGTCPIFTPTPG